MAAVVCFALLCSLLVALTLVPSLARRLLQGEHTHKHGPVVRWFERNANSAVSLFERVYNAALRKSLQNATFMLAVAAVALLLSFRLLPLVNMELRPETDEGRIDISLEMPMGTPLERTA